MNISRAFVSSFAELEDSFRNDHMKLCFLWHDEIMLEVLNEYSRNNYASQILNESPLDKGQLSIFTDVVVPLQDRVSKELIEQHRNTRQHGYPRWGKDYKNFTYPKPENAQQYAHNMLLAHIQRDWGIKEFDGADVEHAEGRARVAINAVSLWEHIQQETECMMEASFDERLAMVSASMFNSNSEKAIEPFTLFETSVPNLSSVPWSEVIDLKRKGHFDRLRVKLKEIVSVSKNDLATARQELSHLEIQATEEIIEKYRPNVRKVALESAAANIPCVPILNPISAFFGVRDTIKEKRKFNDLAWLYLLRDVRNLVNEG